MRKYRSKDSSVGIIKEFDNLWRIVIPKEIRELYKFDKEVELITTPDGVLMRNPKYRLIKVVKQKPLK